MTNPLDMTGKTVLVTGASSGIGRETAILLAELNARVVLVARNTGRLEETSTRLEGQGHIVEPFDLSDAQAIPAWLKRLTARIGPLDGLVHSAGVVHNRPVQFEDAASIEALLRINLTSAMMLINGFRKVGCAQKGAGAVLLSSVAGLVGETGLGAYSASKAALIGFTRSAALELASFGLRLNCVAPGMVETEMLTQVSEYMPNDKLDRLRSRHPLGFGRPRDAAHAIAFLLADTGRWITGTTLVVDGGYSAGG